MAFLEGPSEPVRLGAGLDDVGTIGDPIEQRLAEARVRHHLRSFRKRQIRSQNHRRLLGPVRDDLKKQLRSDVGDDLVHDYLQRSLADLDGFARVIAGHDWE